MELQSPSDRRSRLHLKMLEWIENGAKLDWLIDPVALRVTIYRPSRDPESLSEVTAVAGEGPIAGFTLDLTRIWAGL